MKLVKESIHFERKKDHHESIGVGTFERYGIKIIHDNIVEYNDNYGQKRNIHINSIVELLNKFFNYFKKDEIYKIPQFNDDDYKYEYKGKPISNKDIILLLKDNYTSKFIIINNCNNWNWQFPFDIIKSIKESINFNRSEDPHKSLGIGNLNRFGITINDEDDTVSDKYYTKGVNIDHYVNALNNYFRSLSSREEAIIRNGYKNNILNYEYKGKHLSYKDIVLMLLEKIKDPEFRFIINSGSNNVIKWDEIYNSIK